MILMGWNVCSAQMDSTMMQKVCSLQRLMAENPVPTFKKVKKKEENAHIRINEELYEELLAHLRKKAPGLQDYRVLPRSSSSGVFLPFATPMMSVQVPKSNFPFRISPQKPNNCVMYAKQGGRKGYCMIKQLYRFENGMGGIKQVVLIEPILEVFGKKVDCPSRNFRYNLHLMGSAVGQIKTGVHLVLNISDVLAPCAYRVLPPHTFGLTAGGIILKAVIH